MATANSGLKGAKSVPLPPQPATVNSDDLVKSHQICFRWLIYVLSPALLRGHPDFKKQAH
jgi:hypothetical protein